MIDLLGEAIDTDHELENALNLNDIAKIDHPLPELKETLLRCSK